MDQDKIIQAWKLEPQPMFRAFCYRCGIGEDVEGTAEDVVRMLKNVGWELRRTGPWCDYCCKDQRSWAEKVFAE